MTTRQPRRERATTSDQADLAEVEIRALLDERVDAMQAKDIEPAMALYALNLRG